ncbi:respiratory nitrate reductase subunit gamma [Hypericibacter terrae]|jgi:nitrate reductase gamma subunit|uniref:nitrate reductase (quinone) n=1 Tax=Hypericibacter terrae TaxID=2602015 RepID=A0A5J6MMV7_9PROT|nr:respiratory nitrate reductase subunit gamma [Hypericibacter terrae]QEX18972.1 respiratory nitrate reductase subunit gamma [Hypericibacter terrae]
MTDYLNLILFGLYPYIALSVFLIGSLIRFDREQYSWRSGSSQLLRARQLRWGSNLFHVGVLFILAGHVVGLLTPHQLYTLVITVEAKQMLAIVSGGTAGVFCFIGLTMLIHRRLFDPRIRKTSSVMDIVILLMIWAQLVLGLITLPFSLQHADGSVMLRLSEWAQRIVTFRGGAADQILGLAWPYQLHLVMGMTLFLLFPFSRLVHIWSAPVGYLFRNYQVVRRRDAGRDLAVRRGRPV